jgi:uncharacterized protein
MKVSEYNYEVALDGNTHLLFNFYTLNLIALTTAEARAAKRLTKNPDQLSSGRTARRLRALLIEKGFLIDDGVDERALLRASHMESKFQTASLGLTIAPTVACNFSCVYCYEGRKRRSMTREVEDALTRTVEKGVRTKGSLSVVWFGGEPLLSPDRIKRLSERFMKICDKASARYSAMIVTNGYLLDQKALEMLTGLSVLEAQITLDGPEDVHDARRPLKGGGKTYARILGNVVNAADKIGISLRMNVDHTNRDHIDDMLNLLVREGLHNKVGFHIGHTSPYTKACQGVSEVCLTNQDFSLLSLETLAKMIDRGFASAFNVPQKKDLVCLAENARAFVITPRGGVANCWNDVDNPRAEIGHLLRPSTRLMEKNAKRWERDPFELECRDCRLLPICMGGCPYLFKKDGKIHCHPWKHNLHESLAFFYYYQKTGRERQIVRAFKDAVEAAKALKAADPLGAEIGRFGPPMDPRNRARKRPSGRRIPHILR